MSWDNKALPYADCPIHIYKLYFCRASHSLMCFRIAASVMAIATCDDATMIYRFIHNSSGAHTAWYALTCTEHTAHHTVHTGYCITIIPLSILLFGFFSSLNFKSNFQLHANGKRFAFSLLVCVLFFCFVSFLRFCAPFSTYLLRYLPRVQRKSSIVGAQWVEIVWFVWFFNSVLYAL